MNDHDMKQNFLSWLPWYINGTLAPNELEWMHEYLRNHPSAAAEVIACRTLKQSVKDDIREEDWNVLLQRVEQKSNEKSIGWLYRLRAYFQSLRMLPITKSPFFAYAAICLILAQGGILAVLQSRLTDTRAELVRSRAERIEIERPVLQLRFKPSAAERDTRMLLSGIDGKIIDGPNQFGDYIVIVPQERIHALEKVLALNPLIEKVDVLPTVPPVEH